MEGESKATRVAQACKEALQIKLREEHLRDESERKQSAQIKEVAEKYNVTHKHIVKIIEDTRYGHKYGV